MLDIEVADECIARYMDEAQTLIPRLGELGVNVVFVDGNFTPWDKSGNDGTRIIGEIKNNYPDMIIIDYSGESVLANIVDFQLPKGVNTSGRLDDILSQVEQKLTDRTAGS